MVDVEVAIIGGGLSGLTTGSILRDAGINAIILEASATPGGRIQSIRDPETRKVLADLGPTWIWPAYQETADRWIRKLGLSLHAQYEQGLGVYEAGMDHEVQHMMFPGQQGIARITGGPQAIVDGLISKIGWDSIRTRSPVLAVEKQENKYLLRGSAEEEIVRAGKIVVATPLRIAVTIPGLEKLLPPSAKNIAVSASTWMASQCKVSAVYENPFWREAGLSGRVASRVGPLVEIHDISGPDGSPAALFGFCGLPHEIRQKIDLKNEVIRQLVRCLGEKAGNPERLIVKDWAREPYICSERDLEESPQHPGVLPEVIRQPLDNGGIFFGVSETAQVDPGLISGAFEAGERVASQVLNGMK